jgi:hypothetical protein
MRYPDGPHDAEALAVHPDGSIYILTKDAKTPGLYRLAAERWRKPAGVQTLEHVATFDFEKLLPKTPSRARSATSMSIARNGKHALVLTYLNAIELNFDLSQPIPAQSNWREDRDYRRVELVNLNQQEAVAFAPNGRGFVYSTERSAMSFSRARVMRVSCLR